MEEKEFNYINVIPLVDVMLVLLTIVLTTATFVATGVIPLDLPKASQAREEAVKTQTIEVDKSGSLYLNSRPVSLNGLKEALRPINRATPFLIRADKEIALQVFVDLLDMVKGEGFRKVSLQTERRKGMTALSRDL